MIYLNSPQYSHRFHRLNFYLVIPKHEAFINVSPAFYSTPIGVEHLVEQSFSTNIRCLRHRYFLCWI